MTGDINVTTRVNHGNNEFVNKSNPKNHINGIENFWGGIAKVRLAKSYADLERTTLISISKNVNLGII